MKIAAIVPMRHSSQRVPGKNYRAFAGVPLYHHVINALQGSRMIDEIVIDTDSPTIMEDAAQAFPDVRVIERPENLRDPETPMNDVLLNTINAVAADFYLQTHSTNPLLTAETIRDAVTCFKDGLGHYDSLFSVTRRHVRIWNEETKPINHDPAVLLQTQDLPPFFEENSCIFLFSKQSLLDHSNRIGASPQMFEMNPVEAQDIDEESDFLIAEALFKTLYQKA